jgi:hypothetical protein
MNVQVSQYHDMNTGRLGCWDSVVSISYTSAYFVFLLVFTYRRVLGRVKGSRNRDFMECVCT